MADLLPCPFCSAAPVWKSKSMSFGTGASGMEPPMRALGCENSSCPIRPATTWRDTQEWNQKRRWHDVDYDNQAIADWNTRK